MEIDLQIGKGSSTLMKMPSPTAYDIEYEDQSKSDATRTEAGKMYKKRIGTVRKATYTWTNLSDEECQKIFQAVQPEYVFAKILDPFKKNNVVQEFYVGNRKASYSAINDGTWSNVSFSLIERSLVNF